MAQYGFDNSRIHTNHVCRVDLRAALGLIMSGVCRSSLFHIQITKPTVKLTVTEAAAARQGSNDLESTVCAQVVKRRAAL